MHLTLALPIYAWYDRIAAWLLLAVFLAVSHRFFASGARAVPVLPIVTANIYIFYGLAQFIQEGLNLVPGYYSPTKRAITLASWLAVLGELSLLTGYWVATRCTRRPGNIFDIILPVPDKTWKVASVLYSLPSISTYILLTLFPKTLPQIQYPLSVVFNAYLALALLFYLGYSHKSLTCKITGWLVLLAMVCVGLIQGTLAALLGPIMEGALCWWLWDGTIRVRWFVVALLLFLVLDPVKLRYRELSWQDKAVTDAANVGQRLNDWSRAFYDVWFGFAASSKEDNIKKAEERISDLLELALVIDVVPEAVPFDRGQSLRLALVYWIPRFAWPSKPPTEDLIYNRYSVIFGFTTVQGLRGTTAVCSAYEEGFWNNGAAGLIVFLAMTGMLLGLILGNSRPPAGASVLVCVAYLGPFPVETPWAIAVALPGAVTFVAGITLAMWTLAALAVMTRRGEATLVNSQAGGLE
jgi:hypothetical protein